MLYLLIYFRYAYIKLTGEAFFAEIFLRVPVNEPFVYRYLVKEKRFFAILTNRHGIRAF